MTDEESKRLEAYREGPYITFDHAEDLYGLSLQEPAARPPRLTIWQNRTGRKVIQEGLPRPVDRYQLENFFQATQTLPITWAALRLAMATEVLTEVLGKLVERNLLALEEYVPDAPLIDERVLKDLHRCLPEAKDRLFTSNRGYVRFIHDEIREKLDIVIAARHCVTSLALNEAETEYSHDIDYITLEPIALKRQVWLEFRKPLNLRPDVCSLKFYADNEADLKGDVMSHQQLHPDILATLRGGNA